METIMENINEFTQDTLLAEASLTWGGSPLAELIWEFPQPVRILSQETDWAIPAFPLVWQMSLTWGG